MGIDPSKCEKISLVLHETLEFFVKSIKRENNGALDIDDLIELNGRLKILYDYIEYQIKDFDKA